MTSELWQRLKPRYHAALEVPRERRAQFLAEACGDDPALKEELEALLAVEDEGTGSFDEPLVDLRRDQSPRKQAFREGDVLLGRFRIVRLLGSGGMGEVYEAKDLRLEPGRIALKTIRPAVALNHGAISRFKEEVNRARDVSGPGVCRIYELHLPPQSSANECAAFLTMEFLDGQTLADRIAERGPLPAKEALQVAAQLCAALQSIHKANVVHRDIKPRNIMLVPRNGSEDVVIMDFGLARAVAIASPQAETALTVPGTIMGTPEYMAPEQFEGRAVSPATDIYALGIVLYEMVTGKRPFEASSPFGAAVRRGRRPDPPSSISHGVPPSWDDVIAKCLEYDPVCRYQSASEVIDALRRRSWVIWRFPQGQRIALTQRSIFAAAAVLLAVLGASGWSLYRASRIHVPPPTAQRWYDVGVMDLREGTYLAAAKALGMALDSDQKFALAHARLAESWDELDFTGPAQQEMLLATAPGLQSSIPAQDRQYVDAVRATLVRDYSAAAQDYESILKHLPADRKADGYVDLGRAYEKAGRVKDTITSYEKAAKMRPDDPAPFVHLGIWQSRQRNPAAAEAAFSRAEALYEAGSNLEGRAEVAYQRGYAANEVADSEHARDYLEKSLATARQIPSVQLEVRSLSQLSSVEYNSGKDDKAIEDANRAIQLARDNGLEYWSTDGLMRLGNAYLDKGRFADAEVYSQQALHLARQYQHPRLEADAELTLASLRDLQGGKWDEQIAFAQGAKSYYRDYGFLNMAAGAFELVIRGEEGKGDFGKARSDSLALLRLARSTESDLSVENAEEMLGAVSFDLQEYPEALAHYEVALRLSRSLHNGESYKALECADALWRLGRYKDAEEMLRAIPADAKQRIDVASSIVDIRAQMQLSEGQYDAALSLSRKALQAFPNMDTGKVADFHMARAMAEAQLGQTAQAGLDANELLAEADKEADEGLIAEAEMIKADILIRSHLADRAKPLAEQANRYFSSKEEKESQWLSLLCLAKSAKESQDTTAAVEQSKKALDILAALEQSWSPAVFQQYISRPDHQLALRELNTLKNS